MYDPNSPEVQSDPEVLRLRDVERSLENAVTQQLAEGHIHTAEHTQQHLNNVDAKLHRREETIEERTLAGQSQNYYMGR